MNEPAEIESGPSLCAGGAVIRVKFAETAEGGLRDLSRVTWHGRAYNAALCEGVLDPFLARWTDAAGDQRSRLHAVTDAAMVRCLEAFQDARRSPQGDDNPAMLAALAVTANLQRTLTGLAERLARPGRPEGPESVTLCRTWCGFPPPKLRSARDATAETRTLGRALGCNPAEVTARCQQALRTLRSDLRRGAVLSADDLAGYANRSDAVAGGTRVDIGRPV